MFLLNPFVFASNQSARFLAHFDGADGSTSFVDSSGNNVTIATVATARLSTTIKKFGTASLYLPDSTAYCTIPAATANFSGSDFCIEFWVYPVTKSLFGNITGHTNAATGSVGFNLQWKSGGDKLRFLSGYVGSGVWTIDVTSTHDVTLNTWTHIAITREGQILRVFVNGAKSIEVNSASTLWAESDLFNFGIGVGAGNNRFGTGYIDEYRIMVGDAIYTSDFTPPSSPF